MKTSKLPSWQQGENQTGKILTRRMMNSKLEKLAFSSFNRHGINRSRSTQRYHQSAQAPQYSADLPDNLYRPDNSHGRNAAMQSALSNSTASKRKIG